MKDRLPVLRITDLPATVELEITRPVEREVRAYFYRRGEDSPVAWVKVQRIRSCTWEVAMPKAMEKWKPGRYEMRVQTSAVDVAAVYELEIGTMLGVGGASVKTGCGDCCV